eukprot:TRINITY_DN60543_c0_g1_i1.p1 TRINITY_DN60543_c0_g1~~TRINITY_DN60543_c0_g1_i1.p1  ORF type:complete len:734 (+),score=201.50 TRINITY_DN60543_c0_g1_i1:74-2275(+)
MSEECVVVLGIEHTVPELAGRYVRCFAKRKVAPAKASEQCGVTWSRRGDSGQAPQPEYDVRYEYLDASGRRDPLRFMQSETVDKLGVVWYLMAETEDAEGRRMQRMFRCNAPDPVGEWKMQAALARRFARTRDKPKAVSEPAELPEVDLPEQLFVSAPGQPTCRQIAGRYLLEFGSRLNGGAQWTAEGGRRLYSLKAVSGQPTGRWGIAECEADVDIGVTLVCTPAPHLGDTPDLCSWGPDVVVARTAPEWPRKVYATLTSGRLQTMDLEGDGAGRKYRAASGCLLQTDAEGYWTLHGIPPASGEPPPLEGRSDFAHHGLPPHLVSFDSAVEVTADEPPAVQKRPRFVPPSGDWLPGGDAGAPPPAGGGGGGGGISGSPSWPAAPPPREPGPPGACGLRNVGNTCYMNATLQCLGASEALSRELRSAPEGLLRGALACALSADLKQMWADRCPPSIRPAEVRRAIVARNSRFQGCDQHDASELLYTVLSELHADLLAVPSPRTLVHSKAFSSEQEVHAAAAEVWEHYSRHNDTAVARSFATQLRQAQRCGACGAVVTNLEEPGFGAWPVRLPPATSSRCELEQCLDSCFGAEEQLERLGSEKCSSCGAAGGALHQSTVVLRAPECVTLHLLRFHQYQDAAGEFRYGKHDQPVDYPVEGLDLSRYVQGGEQGAALYDLYGVVIHRGTLQGGHYTAKVRNYEDSQWRYFNDDWVTDGATPQDDGAFLLFYRRRRG